jgi:hypothetical protein
MIPIDEYAKIIRGRTPEMAFLELESRYRSVLERKMEHIENNYSYNSIAIEYMNHTLAAAQTLHLDILNGWSVPSHADRDLSDRFHDFTTAVDNFKVQVAIDHARGENQFSVALSKPQKDQIRHFVQQIKDVIDNSHLATEKKERLYDLINQFLAEVERDRTSWQVFSDLIIGVAHLGSEAAKELEPARKFIDSISRLLGRAKEFEDSAPQLPPPSTPRQLPPPPKNALPKGGDLDDEIPF